jgi:peptidoglycan hydrolase-like protein with peptidoglycan-binding domain
MKDIQGALADAGLYGGAVDGKTGPMTKAAIEKFQRRAGLELTGVPSEALLASLRKPAKPDRTEPVIEAKPVPPKPVAAGPSPETVAERTRYRKVQVALNDIGYGPVSVDGEPGQETADAIRRFELDNGLPLTGNPTDRVIARLVRIGALPQR